MERIRNILGHPLYREQFTLLQEAEKDRTFCRHTMEHFLDVARIMYIFRLEHGSGPDKDVVYAVALLHDIGRYEQISKGTPHHLSGARLAGVILPECGYTEEESERILRAVRGHRQKDVSPDDLLSDWLYRADKLSRNCFCCPAAPECNWPVDRKNRYILY